VSFLAAVLKSARLWAPLREPYEPLPVLKRGPGQALTPEQTARLIETAKTNDHWFVALCATVLAYATGCRSIEITKLQLGDLVLDGNRPFIRLRAENTKGRRSRSPALNHPQFTAPNTTPTSTAFGTVTGEFGWPRVIQFGLKALF
jgi:integrase